MKKEKASDNSQKQEKYTINKANAEKQKDDEKSKEMEAMLKRIQADFENYKKYVEKEKQQLISTATKSIIVDLLPVIDSFENAIRHYEKENKEAKTAENSFVLGLKNLYNQLMAVMQKYGLKRIDCIGKKFDPYLHEALMQEESDKEDNIILAELQPGYMLNNYVIRHSKVKISKRSEKSQTNKQENSKKEAE